MGLAYKSTRWLDRLWGEHLSLSASCRELVKAGISKQGDAFAGFPADLHTRLYLPSEPEETGTAPDWSMQLHRLATETAEWDQLRMMTSRNSFSAGIAAEILLEHLIPHVPDAPDAEPEGGGADNNEQKGDKQDSGDSPQNNQGDADNDNKPSDSDIRAALRKAARSARDAVQDAESAIEGMAPGIGVSRNNGPADLKAIRDAHEKLKASPRLKQIAQLAGRFERIAASKARSKVKPSVGEIHGVEMGDSISRLLPSELVHLRHPKLKLAFMARLLERRALTYAMQGREPQGKGPIVILLDESSSMRNGGRDIWSKAVCLALLSTATRQKRPWHLVAFNGAVIREVSIEPGKGTPADIQEALDHRSRGGTDFNAPVLRSIEIIRTSRTMKKADVVIITDGEDELEQETIDAATRLTRDEGVSFFVVGVGAEAARTVPITLGPIATSIHAVARTDETAGVADLVNLEKGGMNMKTKQFADAVIDQVGGSRLTLLGKLKKLTVVVLDSRNGGELSIDGIKVDAKKIVVEVGNRRTG